MTPLEEAQELFKRVSIALNELKRFDGFSADIKESEIKFRYESIIGILLMVRNDITGLLQEWKEP